MTPDISLVVATVASAAAGFVNSIAGGGGLVSIPILLGLFPAAPPAALFGTNKAAMVCGTLQAAGSYGRHVCLPWGMLGPAIGAALVGGLAGAGLVTIVSSDWLRPLLPVMLGLVLVHTVLHHKAGRVHAPWLAPRAEAAAGTAIAGGLGLYDGFFGPGTGSFFIHLFVRLLGFDFLHAAAAAKILNAATNLGALVTFAWTGNVWWSLALPMAVANIAGSWAGSRLALRHGAAFVRGVFVAVVAALVIKTAYDVYLAPPAPTGVAWSWWGTARIAS
jgi:uncharacterized membrane protein YfcA